MTGSSIRVSVSIADYLERRKGNTGYGAGRGREWAGLTVRRTLLSSNSARPQCGELFRVIFPGP